MPLKVTIKTVKLGYLQVTYLTKKVNQDLNVVHCLMDKDPLILSESN